MTVIRHRAQITEDVPSRLLTLELPPGVSLAKWVKMEEARIKYAYPEAKDTEVPVDPDLAESFLVSKAQLKRWTQSYKLAKLEIREEMGWARTGTVNGVPFVRRRQYPVKGYEVHGYELDAIFPV